MPFNSYGVPLNNCSSSLVTGSTSHKLVTSDVSRILWLYYNDSVSGPPYFRQLTLTPFERTLFLICAGNELFFVALYLMKWVRTPIGLGVYSIYTLSLTHITYPQAMAVISFPICFTKNIINLVQLWKASKILVGVDLAERAIAREANLKARKT